MIVCRRAPALPCVRVPVCLAVRDRRCAVSALAAAAAREPPLMACPRCLTLHACVFSSHAPQPPLPFRGLSARPHWLLRELWALPYVSPCVLCTRCN
jgi:hypothetical protein